MKLRALIALAVLAAIVAGFILFRGWRSEHGSGSLSDARAEAAESKPSGPGRAASTSPRLVASRPRRFSESEPAGEAAGRPALEIEVIDPNGGPAAKARLVLHRPEQILGSAVTGDAGLATFESGEGEAGLFVFPAGAPRHATTISIEAGRRRVHLPAGVAITGRVVVRDAPPSEPIEFTVDCPALPEMGPHVWGALRGELPASFTTTPSGEFTLAGLPAGSEWTFYTRRPEYEVDEVVAAGASQKSVTAPASGVLIRLARMPIVRGRAVSGNPRAPAVGAICRTTISGVRESVESSVECGQDGRFEVVAGFYGNVPTRVTRIQIILQSAHEVTAKPVVLEPGPDRDVDVGDIEIPAGRTIRFTVRDPSGAPIEGAFAKIGNTIDPATRTDAEGHGTVLAGENTASIRVAALKYATTEVAIPRSLPEDLQVTLQRSAGAEIKIAVPTGAALGALRVRVSASELDMFVTTMPEPGPGGVMTVPDGDGQDLIAIMAGATPHCQYSSHGRSGHSYWFAPRSDGCVILAGIRPGLPLAISAVDRFDHVLATVEARLAAGEWRVVELPVTKPARSLRGKVRDPGGSPVARARVTLDSNPGAVGARGYWPTVGTSRPVSTETDSDGRFALTDLYDDVVHAGVDKPGFVPLILRGFALPPEGTEVEWTLATGCTLTVVVLTAEGEPIRDLQIIGEISGFPRMRIGEWQRGTYVFGDLPCGADMTITTQWAQREWSRAVHVGSDQAEVIKMPTAGKVSVDYSHIPVTWCLLKLTSGTGTDAIQQTWFIEAPRDDVPHVFLASPVLPGEYGATLVNIDGEEVPLAIPQTITVRADATTRIVFEKPR